MFIGSLADKRSMITGTYSYTKRGVNVPAFPDLYPDSINGKISIGSGNLFNGKKVGWKWTTLLDVGIDIKFELDKASFIDRVLIRQESGSGFGSVEILTGLGSSNLNAAGRLDAPTEQILDNNEITVQVGETADKVVIRLNSYFKNIIIESVDIIGAVFDTPVIYPIPNSIDINNDVSIKTEDLKYIIIRNDAKDETRFAADMLQEKIYENTSRKVAIASLSTIDSTQNAIVLGTYDEIVKFNSDIVNKPSQEGFFLSAMKGTVILAGIDRRGLIYGVETILALISGGSIPICTINDYPRMQYRGFHMGLPPREEIPFIKRLIRYMLAPMRYNTIFLEFAGGMRFDRHPEINEAWINGNNKAKEGKWPSFPHGGMVSGGLVLEKSEVADLVEYARSYGVDVIPEVQSLSHVQYLTIAYPEIAEIEEAKQKKEKIDLNKEDIPPSEFYAHSYCPSNEKSYDLIYDIIDEIVEVVKPSEYVHMGHDEVYQIGICPVCKDKDPADLFALHVNRMYEYLAKKNLKMMIWGDMLHDVTRYKTPPAITKIPKDIVLLDFIWYFHFDKDLEDRLLDHGFKVIMGNMYSSHYPRYEKRIEKEGMIGAQVSTWCREDEYTFGYMGKMYDTIYSANMMWSVEYNSNARLVYDHIISKIIPVIRSKVHETKYPTQESVKKCFTMKLPDNLSIDAIPCELLTSVAKDGINTYNNVAFDLNKPQIVLSDTAYGKNIPVSTTFSVSEFFDSLVFLHTTTKNVEVLSFKPMINIGNYKITYDDGTCVTLPVEYGANIAVWSRKPALPMPQAYYRHEGYMATYLADPYIRTKTKSGQDVTVYGYEWINPFKDKKIASVALTAEGNTDAAIILFAVTGIQI